MTDLKTITFNTGRAYTENGQRIAATELANGCVLFLDIDRGIDGVIEATLDRHSVMTCYDFGRYGYPSEERTGLGYDDIRALLDALRASAAAVPAFLA